MTPLSNHKRKRGAAVLSQQIISLIFVASTFLLLDLVFTNSLWSIGAVFVSALALSRIVWSQQLNQFCFQLQNLNRRYHLLTIGLGVITVFSVLHSLSNPASAQFYQAAQSWLETELTKNLSGSANTAQVTNMLGLAFNVLRALFLIYLGISIVKIVNAARDDEDWQNLARTPLIVVIAVTAGDVLASLIVGGGGTP